MNIAVNTRCLIEDKLEGIGWFTYQTLKRITQSHPEHNFYFIFDRPFSESFIFAPNVHPVIVGPQARHPLLWWWWFEKSIPKVLKQINADIFMSTDGFNSLNIKTKSLLVIHDLGFEHYPQHVPWLVKQYYSYFTPRYAHKANQIATVSSYSKDDIAKLYDIAKSKIDVVYNGSDESYKPISEKEQICIREKYTLGKPYFLFVGSIHPRKNLEGLLRAFDLFKKSSCSELKLLVVGRMAWQTSNVESILKVMQFRKEVIFIDHQNLPALSSIMASAFALVYPSLFEGFGIPIIEAMNCEVPVITSNSSSMIEVAGKAALFSNPKDVKSIASQMAALQKEPTLRTKLIAEGKKQAEKYSWDKSAMLLWKSLEKINAKSSS